MTESTKNKYIEWVNFIIRASLPDSEQEPELFELGKTYQLHRHSKTCRKYKTKPFRFNFGRFFCDETIIAEQLRQSMSREEKIEKLNGAKMF